MSQHAKAPVRQTLSRRVFIRMSAIAGGAILAPWLGRNRDALVQAATQTVDPALEAAFYAAVAEFNNHDSAKLTPLLASNVLLLKVHPTHQPPKFDGSGAVMGYFDHAWQSTPVHTWMFNPSYDGGPQFVQPSPNTGTVSGTAWWHDSDGDDPDGPLNYEFKFQKIGGKWQVKSLWGCYPGKPCSAKP